MTIKNELLPIIDLHADTFSKKLLKIKKSGSFENTNNTYSYTNDFLNIDMTDEIVKEANIRIQTQSLFMFDSFMEKPLHNALHIISLVKEHIKQNENYYLLTNKEILNFKEKYGILLSIEGLEIIEENLCLIDLFYDLGVRIIAPTWNRLTPWFSPVTQFGGATHKAMDLINILNKLNILLDISHLSDQSVFDIEKMYNGVLIASHSNIRQLNPAKRNLSDDLIKIVSERNGLIGINFYPDFLKTEINFHRTSDYPGSFYWILKIIEYLDRLNTLDCICFGSDFDGISRYSPGLESYKSVHYLKAFLEEKLKNNEVIEKLFYKNALTVIERVI